VQEQTYANRATGEPTADAALGTPSPYSTWPRRTHDVEGACILVPGSAVCRFEMVWPGGGMKGGEGVRYRLKWRGSRSSLNIQIGEFLRRALRRKLGCNIRPRPALTAIGPASTSSNPLCMSRRQPRVVCRNCRRADLGDQRLCRRIALNVIPWSGGPRRARLQRQ